MKIRSEILNGNSTMEDRIVEIKKMSPNAKVLLAMTVEKFRIKESVRSIEHYKKRKPRSITYRQRKYRKDIVERHIATYGYICSGYKRDPILQ